MYTSFVYLFIFVAFDVSLEAKLTLPTKSPPTTTAAPKKGLNVTTLPPAKKPSHLVANKIMGSQITEQEWLNSVFGQLSPKFAEFASSVLSEQVEPLIQKVLKTSHLPNVKFHFEKTDFGSVPPQITNMITHKNPEGQEAQSVIVDFDFVYLGDCDLQVSIMGIRSGVKDVQMSGRGRVVLKPTTKSLPLVGGLQVYFLEVPAINFDLDGIADICDWPILRRKVRREIRDDTAKKCVYPNRLIIPMSSSVDPMHVKCFEPTGLVAVKVISAAGLPRKKGLRVMVGQDKPDPYVKARIGAQVFKTRVIKNKANPVWPDDEPWLYYMLETPKGHRMRLDVYDQDSMSHDEFMGFARVEVVDYMGLEEPITTTVALEDDPMENNPKKPTVVSGEVTFSMRWMPLVAANGSVVTTAPVIVLTIFVYSCNNLVEMSAGGGFLTDGDAPSTQLRVKVGSQTKEGEVKKNNLHPSFDECYTFMLTQQDSWQEMIATIEVLELENGSTFGTYTLPLVDLSNGGPIQRRVVSISPDKPHITITLSANIKMSS